jgi:hypothetical protein
LQVALLGKIFAYDLDKQEIYKEKQLESKPVEVRNLELTEGLPTIFIKIDRISIIKD